MTLSNTAGTQLEAPCWRTPLRRGAGLPSATKWRKPTKGALEGALGNEWKSAVRRGGGGAGREGKGPSGQEGTQDDHRGNQQMNSGHQLLFWTSILSSIKHSEGQGLTPPSEFHKPLFLWLELHGIRAVAKGTGVRRARVPSLLHTGAGRFLCLSKSQCPLGPGSGEVWQTGRHLLGEAQG